MAINRVATLTAIGCGIMMLVFVFDVLLWTVGREFLPVTHALVSIVIWFVPFALCLLWLYLFSDTFHTDTIHTDTPEVTK